MKLNSNDIEEKVSVFFGINPERLKERNNYHWVSYPRQVVWYLIRELLDNEEYTYKKIGSLYNKNHATVLYGVKSIKNLLDVDKSTREIIAALKKDLCPTQHV